MPAAVGGGGGGAGGGEGYCPNGRGLNTQFVDTEPSSVISWSHHTT